MTLLEIFNKHAKAKEEFEKWYDANKWLSTKTVITPKLYIFWELPFSFQQGVVLEWLREQGFVQNYYVDGQGNHVWKFTHSACWKLTRNKDYAVSTLQAIEKGIELI